MAATTELVGLADVRQMAADALWPATDTDPTVLVEIVDSLVPPAIMLEWDDPWIRPGAGVTTLGPCMFQARLAVICVAGRLEPGPGVEVLEQLVAYTIDRLKADSYSWALDSVTAPLQRDLAGVSYLAANVIYAVPVTV